MSEFVFQRIHVSDCVVVWILRSSLYSGISGDNSVLDTNGVSDLSAGDSKRWRRYRCVPKKNQFLASRRAISFVLMKEFGLDHQFSWQTSDGGCPRLLDARGRDVAAVSLSHSENVIVIGIDRNCECIGVDCEVLRGVVPKTVFQYLDGIDRAALAAEASVDPVWCAAIRWTEFEADWKMLQNRHMMENHESGSLNAGDPENEVSSDVPGKWGSLMKHKWIVYSSCDAAFVTNQAFSPAHSILRDPADVCVCIVSGRRNEGLKMSCAADGNPSVLC